VEVHLAGALMLAPAASPAGVAAGVLLYRAFTFGIEIPVAGVLLAAWAWRQRAQGCSIPFSGTPGGRSRTACGPASG
jgi:hypothetical protein